MQKYEKPLPFITEDGEAFWKGCKRHELLIQRCNDCGNHQFPPRLVCRSCFSMNLEWIKASGRGVVYSYSVVSRAPSEAFAADVPYIVALIDLDEGGRMMSNVIKCQPDNMRIGMPVVVEFDDITEEVTLPKFRPA